MVISHHNYIQPTDHHVVFWSSQHRTTQSVEHLDTNCVSKLIFFPRQSVVFGRVALCSFGHRSAGSMLVHCWFNASSLETTIGQHLAKTAAAPASIMCIYNIILTVFARTHYAYNVTHSWKAADSNLCYTIQYFLAPHHLPRWPPKNLVGLVSY